MISQTEWDERFIAVAEMVSTWSKDPSTSCGAVIVRPDKSIVSVGFNGFPIGCSDDPDLYADRNTKLSRVIHAEVNAILLAREPLHGCTMYTHPAGFGPSCDRCATCVIQSGIKRIVHYRDESHFASRWKEPAEIGLRMYHEAGVEVAHLVDHS